MTKDIRHSFYVSKTIHIIVIMFQNEFTWGKTSMGGNTDDFHAKFDESVKKVQDNLGKNYPIIINGKEIYSESTFEVRSSSDQRIVVGTFPLASEEQVQEAIDSAKKAFPVWSKTDYKERVKIFRYCADQMAGKKFELAAILSLENGKNRIESMGDVDEAIDFVRFYAEQLEQNEGFEKDTPHPNPKEKTRSVLKPYGVWGVISPFNFPSAIAIGMTSGALITGNTVVLKPASAAPVSSFMFAKEIYQHIPKGAINFVTGGGTNVGKKIIESADVAGIAFTGSRQVGMKGFREFTQRIAKPYLCEMGGKNPVIVTENADLEKASHGVMTAAFGYGGQKCSACSRVYVHKDVEDKFLEMLVDKTKEIKMGYPWEPDVFLGGVINAEAVEKFEDAVAEANKDGAVVVGGRVLREGNFEHGFFVEPTVVKDLPKNHRLLKEELFLPFLCVSTFETFDEAIRLSNDTEYGLTAGVFSEDNGEIEKFFDNIEAGTVYANRGASATTAALVRAQPFVGWKASTSRGKGTGGEYYLQQFLREQSQTRCD